MKTSVGSLDGRRQARKDVFTASSGTSSNNPDSYYSQTLLRHNRAKNDSVGNRNCPQGKLLTFLLAAALVPKTAHRHPVALESEKVCQQVTAQRLPQIAERYRFFHYLNA